MKRKNSTKFLQKNKHHHKNKGSAFQFQVAGPLSHGITAVLEPHGQRSSKLSTLKPQSWGPIRESCLNELISLQYREESLRSWKGKEQVSPINVCPKTQQQQRPLGPLQTLFRVCSKTDPNTVLQPANLHSRPGLCH